MINHPISQFLRKIGRASWIVFACLVAGSAGGYVAGNHLGFSEAADRTRRLPSGAIPCKPGPWGELTYTSFTIAAPDDLIHVTCTGYISPSAAQILVGEKGWQQLTRVTHAYHMGCYAAFPAIRIASGFLSSATDPAHRVDIAHTELCTLHLDPSDHSPEQLVVQSLFGDGHMRYSLSRVADATCATMPDDGSSGLRILALAEELVANSTDDMRWTITEWGFRMTLTQGVPQKIGAVLPAFLARLFTQADLDYQAEKDSAIFAIHPGGPKIIDQVSDALGLRPEQSAASRAVLRDYGNMSSATLPHVWDEILKSSTTQPGQLVASVAFGPGLTISGGLFQIED